MQEPSQLPVVALHLRRPRQAADLLMLLLGLISPPPSQPSSSSTFTGGLKLAIKPSWTLAPDIFLAPWHMRVWHLWQKMWLGAPAPSCIFTTTSKEVSGPCKWLAALLRQQNVSSLGMVSAGSLNMIPQMQPAYEDISMRSLRRSFIRVGGRHLDNVLGVTERRQYMLLNVDQRPK